MSLHTTIIYLPWAVKLVYGLICDNIPIFGSRRKAYLIVNTLCGSAVLLALVPNLITNIYAITTLLTIFNANGAFINVVVDALIVQESRK